jgi:hypothetical protein
MQQAAAPGSDIVLTNKKAEGLSFYRAHFARIYNYPLVVRLDRLAP